MKRCLAIFFSLPFIFSVFCIPLYSAEEKKDNATKEETPKKKEERPKKKRREIGC